MIQELQQLWEDAQRELESASDNQGVESFRIKYLGKKGAMAALFGRMGKLSAEERPAFGQAVNELRGRMESALAERKAAVEDLAEISLPSGYDSSLPGFKPWFGRRHVLSSVLEEIVEIFRGMGFSVADGPEVELDYYNFQALNFPDDHPSRDTQDTFYIEKDVLLRTHTSPVQIRYMEKNPPPQRIVVPGRVYRNEAIDASHAAEFHQVEGLYVDEGVSMGDLTVTIRNFAREFFGSGTKVRFRPHFFPFTEPSAEADMTCFGCGGSGCRICGNSGWIEIMGAGMVHPNVFKAAGYDPDKVTGFAFGMGVERIAMLRHGIKDIRLFLENDLRFLSQF